MDALKARSRAPTQQAAAVVEAQHDLDETLKKAQDQGLVDVPAAEQQIEPKAFKASHGVRLWSGMMK